VNAWTVTRRFGRLLFASTQGAAAVAQTTITRFSIVGLNVFTGIITARVLGATGRGETSAMLLWPALLAYLLTFGIPTAIRYWVRREPGREREFLTVSLILMCMASVLCIAIGYLFLPAWLHNYSPEVIRTAQFLMFFTPENMIAVILASMMEALGWFNLSNRTRYAAVAMTLVFLIILAATHTLTPFTAAYSYTVPPVIVAIWAFWKLREYVSLVHFDPMPSLRLLGSYGIRAYGIDILNSLSTQIDQVLVVGLLGARDVGIYVVALNASRVINVLHFAVVTVLFPSAAGLNKQEILVMVGRSARISTGLAALLGIALSGLYFFLIPLMYGSAFDAGVNVARLLTLEAVLFGLVFVLAQAFMTLERPAFVTGLQLLGLAIVVPAMFVLLPHYGLIGAAMALLASTTIRLILVLCAFPLILHVPIPHLLLTRDDVLRMRHLLIRS
jgi:O-antigen/teichoic acid export membrane protein